MHNYTKFGFKKRFRTSGGYFFSIWAHTVTLTVKTGTQTFCMQLQVMMMHQHTMFYQEMLSGSESEADKLYPEDLNPQCDLDLEDNNQKLS